MADHLETIIDLFRCRRIRDAGWRFCCVIVSTRGYSILHENWRKFYASFLHFSILSLCRRLCTQSPFLQEVAAGNDQIRKRRKEGERRRKQRKCFRGEIQRLTNPRKDSGLYNLFQSRSRARCITNLFLKEIY